MKAKLVIGAIVLLAVAATAAYYLVPVGLEVDTETLARREILRTVSATGYLAPVRDRTIPATHAMRIETVEVDVGDAVEAGQLLLSGDVGDLEVERDSLSAEIASLEGELQSSRRTLPANLAAARGGVAAAQEERDAAGDDLRTIEELFEAGAVPETQLKSARIRVATAEASLGGARATLAEAEAAGERIESRATVLDSMRQRVDHLQERIRDYRISSPGNFLVVEVFAESGDFVGPGTPLVLLQSRELHVEAELLAQDAREVARGQQVIVGGDALAEETTAALTRIHPRAVERVSELGVTQRRVPIEAEFSIMPPGAAAGYPVDLEIIVDRADSLGASRDAIFSLDGHYHAFVVRDDRAIMVRVEVGLEGDDYFEILSGLSGGDRVIVNPPVDLEDGARVR